MCQTGSDPKTAPCIVMTLNELVDQTLEFMRSGSPGAKQILWHAILGAAVCFVGFWLADIAGILAPSLSHASAEKWMLMAVACGYCSVGAALTGLVFLTSEY
jgi:hypothetical protein